MRLKMKLIEMTFQAQLLLETNLNMMPRLTKAKMKTSLKTYLKKMMKTKTF